MCHATERRGADEHCEPVQQSCLVPAECANTSSSLLQTNKGSLHRRSASPAVHPLHRSVSAMRRRRAAQLRRRMRMTDIDRTVSRVLSSRAKPPSPVSCRRTGSSRGLLADHTSPRGAARSPAEPTQRPRRANGSLSSLSSRGSRFLRPLHSRSVMNDDSAPAHAREHGAMAKQGQIKKENRSFSLGHSKR